MVPLVRHMGAEDPPDTTGLQLVVDRLEGQTSKLVLLRAGSAELTVRSLSDIEMSVVSAADTYGGAGTTFKCLPAFFGEQLVETQWICPAGSPECEQLFEQVMELVEARENLPPQAPA